MGVCYQPPSSIYIYIDNTAWVLTHRESRGDLGLGQSAECPKGFWESIEPAYQPDAAVELPAHRFSSLPEPPPPTKNLSFPKMI